VTPGRGRGVGDQAALTLLARGPLGLASISKLTFSPPRRRSKFNGSIGTSVLKVFELGVARTGLSSQEASAERIAFVSARIEADDRASYYPGARKVWIKLIVDRDSRKLIGAQAVGYGDVSKRIDVAATAISSGMTIDSVAQLDLAYSPPYGSLWDPLLVAAHAVLRMVR